MPGLLGRHPPCARHGPAGPAPAAAVALMRRVLLQDGRAGLLGGFAALVPPPAQGPGPRLPRKTPGAGADPQDPRTWPLACSAPGTPARRHWAQNPVPDLQPVPRTHFSPKTSHPLPWPHRPSCGARPWIPAGFSSVPLPPLALLNPAKAPSEPTLACPIVLPTSTSPTS